MLNQRPTRSNAHRRTINVIRVDVAAVSDCRTLDFRGAFPQSIMRRSEIAATSSLIAEALATAVNPACDVLNTGGLTELLSDECHITPFFGDWVNRRYLKTNRGLAKRRILGKLLQLVVCFGEGIDGEVEIFARMGG
jgi:hypothetical protein